MEEVDTAIYDNSHFLIVERLIDVWLDIGFLRSTMIAKGTAIEVSFCHKAYVIVVANTFGARQITI